MSLISLLPVRQAAMLHTHAQYCGGSNNSGGGSGVVCGRGGVGVGAGAGSASMQGCSKERGPPFDTWGWCWAL
jgi:hypothetical protein